MSIDAFWVRSSFSGSKLFEPACWKLYCTTHGSVQKCHRHQQSRHDVLRKRMGNTHMGGGEALQSCDLTATLSGRKCRCMISQLTFNGSDCRSAASLDCEQPTNFLLISFWKTGVCHRKSLIFLLLNVVYRLI